MSRRALPSVWLALMILLDIAILPQFVQSALLPNFTLLSVAAMGLIRGRSGGVLHGVVAGLLMDIAVGNPMGMNTVVMGMTGYGCGFISAKRFQRWLMILLGGVGSVLLYQGAWIVYIYMTGARPASQALGQTVWMALISLGSEVVIYTILYWIIRPGGLRYAIR